MMPGQTAISGVVPPAVAEATVMTVWPSVTIERGINPKVEQYVDLDRFDAIDVVVSPGQEWYAAGDLVFRRGQIETLRLPGVSRPESFRRTCLEVRQSYVSVAALQPVSVGAG